MSCEICTGIDPDCAACEVTEWGTDYWGEVMSEPSEQHARRVAQAGGAKVYNRSLMGDWVEAWIPAEAVKEIAQLIERVDADEYWDADPSIYEKYADAILAAGYRKVAK